MTDFEPSPKTCWPEVRALGTSHPNLPLTIIVNPNSGPTGVESDDPMLTCLPALRKSLPKAKLVGYVSTFYGARPATTVKTNVGIYHSWAAAGGLGNGKSVKLDGIFFDELNNDATNATNVALYKSYAATVRKQFGSKSWVVLNPGDPAPAQFYSIADIVVSYESVFKSFKPASIKKNTSKGQPASKQAVMVYDMPKASLAAVVKAVVPTYGWFFATDLVIKKEDVYGRLPGVWAAEVAAVAKADKVKRGVGKW